MECNKDEAMRAMEIAETKMKKNDFEGAQKVALKAQNLYPELENINQLLSICDVHCSARKPMLGSEKDWYGILQVEKFADELTVKKQYRRLALFLHPDKNRFPGAEAAFKLICEANAVLSDSTKKSVYDSKIRVTVRSAPVVPPPHHMNKNPHFNQPYGAHIKVSSIFGNLNQHKPKQTSFSARQDAFWTSCPFCSFRYHFDRKFANTMLRCQKCFKNFMAYEIGAQGVPEKPNVTQFYGFQEKEHVGSQCSANGQRAGLRMESIFKGKRGGKAEKISGSRKESRAGHGDTNNRKTGNVKDKRMRGRKIEEESSESFETSSESDLEDLTIDKNFAATDLNSGSSQVRRSSRRRQKVSYFEEEEEDNDDDLPSALKRSRGSKLSGDNVEREKDTLDSESGKHENENGLPTDADYFNLKGKGKRTVYHEESLKGEDAYDKGLSARRKTDGMTNIGAGAIEIESDSDIDLPPGYSADKDTCQCPDPEFNDFEKERDPSCFAVNQVWACFDSYDGMPRFYAKVKEVLSTSPLELSITWLEPDPADDAQKKWIAKGLPVGCGSFRLGKTELASEKDTFSRQVHSNKGKKRGSLVVYPGVGEVWALFRDWDIRNHSVCKYEVVEVLTDFNEVAGARVCYLDKVDGFVSLFQRSSQSGNDSFMIRPDEVYRFSHRISCFKMKGSEREGVPVGCFELDPASLPLKPDDLYYPGKAKTEASFVNSK